MVRAYCTQWILPSTPRVPNPPGTMTPSRSCRASRASSSPPISEVSIQSIAMSFNGNNIPLIVTPNVSGGVTVMAASGAFPIAFGAAQSLIINGVAGPDAVYSATATFERAAVVPEPASWALMIAGFGGAGAMLRRRSVSRAIAA